MRRNRSILLAPFAMSILACSDRRDSAAPTAPRLTEALGGVSNALSRRLETPRERSQRIALSVPEFAGYFTDESGRTVILLTDTLAAGRAITALRTEFGSSAIREPRLRLAKYTYTRLYQEFPDFRASMLAAAPRNVSMEIDESTNHLVVWAADADHAAKLRGKLARIPLPSDMVEVRVGGEIVQLAGLNDRHRPVTAGYIVNNYGGGLRYVCTMGLIVNYGGTKGMISNSHCTPTLGVDGTVFYQNPDGTNNPNASDIIGTEWIDPTPTPCEGVDYESNLPFQGGCRRADAMLALLNPGVTAAAGYIAKTTTGTTVGSPSWRIVGIDPEWMPNVTVFSKTGRRTGTTSGVITNGCIDVGIVVATGQTVLFKCQGWANIAARPGDSGSPVWRPYPSLGADAVVVNGIMWGGRNCDANRDNCQGLIYSSINGVLMDTGVDDIRP